MPNNDLTIVIPAAGLGRRMKSYGPKCLLDVGNGQILLKRQLEILRTLFPVAEVVLVLGFEAEKVYRIIPNYVTVVENKLFDDTNVIGSISLALEMSQQKHNNILLVYGDLVFNNAALSFPHTESTIVVDNRKQMRDCEVGVTVIDSYASQFAYSLNTKWCQIAYLMDKEAEFFRAAVADPRYRRYFGYEILNMLLNKDYNLKAIEPAGTRITEIDTSRDIDTARSMIKEIG